MLLERKQSTYIYKEMGDAITREKPTGLKGYLFRGNCPKRLARLCFEKRCFRREHALEIEVASEERAKFFCPTGVDGELGAMFTDLSSRNLERFGPNLSEGILAGCSCPFSSQAVVAPDLDLRVTVASKKMQSMDQTSTITFAVSYRRKTAKMSHLQLPI
jgi:hypothetical protein